MTGLTGEQRDLAGRYALFVFKRLRWWQTRYPVFYNEIHDAAMDALIEAARIYDETIDIRFSTFVLRRIRWRIFDALRASTRREKKQGKTVQFKVLSHSNSCEDEDFEAHGDLFSPLVEDVVQDWLCEELFALMTVRQRTVAHFYFVDGLSCSEIAPRIGLRTRTRVRTILNESIADLREHRVVKALQESGPWL